MQRNLFDNKEHAGRRLANVLMSNGPDTREYKINQLLEQEDGVKILAMVIDYLKLECELRKKTVYLQQYMLAIKLSDVDEKSTITSLSKSEYEDTINNKQYKKDNEQTLAHKITEVAYSENYHSAPGIVAQYCDEAPYVWTTYRDECVAESKKLVDACQSQKSCEHLILHLTAIIESKNIPSKSVEKKC